MITNALRGSLALTRSPAIQGLGGLSGHFTSLRSSPFKGTLILLSSLLCILLRAPVLAQPLSDNPTDAAGYFLTLPTTNVGTTTVICTSGTTTTNLSLAGSTSTPASIIPAPSCGNFTATTRDVWIRLDLPATGDNRFRVTLSGIIPSALTNGAMAAYRAPSATGPFTMIGCVTGGNPTAGEFANPSLEITCQPAGSKIYLRIWDQLTPLSNASFSICLQRQNFSTTPIATVRDQPCNALLLTGAAQNLYNTFACDEGFPWYPSCGGYQGGDIWAQFVVPASGAITITAAAGGITQIGLSIYTAQNCSDLSQFNEVGCFTTSTLPFTTPAIRCLTPGSTVYIRAYSTANAQITPPRFGLFRLFATNPTGTAGTVANNLVCNATEITIDGICPNNIPPFGVGFNSNACFTPGIPAPGCGVIGSTTPDVWYKFVAPVNGTVSIIVSGQGAFDPAAALYTTGDAPCNGPLTLVGCDAYMGIGNRAYILESGLVPGRTYYLRVWGEGASGTQQGIFDLCITNPTPPAGSCFYVVRMTNTAATGTQTMRVAIGTDTTNYTTSGGDPNQMFLITIPSGASATFMYYNTGVTGPSTYTVAQLGGSAFWNATVGGAVVGPTPNPASQYTVSSTCAPIVHQPEDCLGGSTICSSATITNTIRGLDGNFTDLSAANRGCLSDETNGGRWFLFRPLVDGTVMFRLVGVSDPNEDLDFAIWDAGTDEITAEDPPNSINVHNRVCSPDGPPIRCSSARLNGATGLRQDMYGRTTENADGFSWVEPLDVTAGHIYIMYVASVFQTAPPARTFQLQWTSLMDSNGNAFPGLLDCTPIILPVELIFLEARAVDAVNVVEWSTGSEWNSDRFVIERRGDDNDFSEIGSIDAMGSSTQRTDYSFIDTDPFNGISYYRLRQYDKNGNFDFSPIVIVHRSDDAEIMVYPNPASDRITILFPALPIGPAVIELRDLTGRIIDRTGVLLNDRDRKMDLSVDDLSMGTYLLSVEVEGRRMVHRFVKK